MNAPVQLPVASKLGAALDLAQHGLRVFPLHPNEKKPRILGWPMQATTDPQQIQEWWTETPDANIGVSAHNLLVVDIDPRNGGVETFERLQLTEPFPETWVVETQGGGRHLYYALPEGITVRNGKLGPGIDIKSSGGYVVGPGSTIDGRPYLWRGGKNPRDQHIASVPQWLIDQREAPHPKSSEAGKRIVEEDDTARDAALDYIRHDAPEADGGQRNNTLFAVAAKLFDFGVSKETALELIRDHWNGLKCIPMLDRDEVETTVHSAMTNRAKAIGAAHPNAPGFEPYEMLTPAARTSLLKGAYPFDPQSLPVRPWILPTFACRRRVTMIAGPGGVAKSTYTLMVAVAVAAGRSDICGFQVPVRGRAAIWNQEDDLEEMQRRLAAIMAAFNVTWDDLADANGAPRLYLNSGVDFPLMLARRTVEGGLICGQQVKQLAEEVRDQNVDLLVLDPLVEMHEAQENDNAHMRAVVGFVRDIAVQGNCAALLATHTRKPPNASSDGFAGDMDAARGASSQFGVVRVGETLFSASPKDAKQWKFDGSHLDYVRLDSAKNNLAPRRKNPVWFRRDQMAIGAGFDGSGGEMVGILRPVALEQRGPRSEADLAGMLARSIAQSFERGAFLPVAEVLKAMDEVDRSAFGDASNRARNVKKAFGGAEEALTDEGVLTIKSRTGRGGLVIKLADEN